MKLKGTDLIHADDSKHRAEVAPSISVTTTFRYTDPESPEHRPVSEFDPADPFRHIYSRYTQDVTGRVEKVLSKINDGYAVTYSSGLTSSFAALVHFQPKRIAISGGYHGVYKTIEVYNRIRNSEVKLIDLDEPYQAGDICWLETPLNPTGESRNIQHYSDKIHAVGGRLIVDSTFAPPPLQYPFKWGADCVMHSGTKYFGGHSDLLCGVLVVKTIEEWRELWYDRTYMGSMMGSVEGWLLLRSLRTLHLRVPRQSATATELAAWLDKLSQVPEGEHWDGAPGGFIVKVWHSSLQAKSAKWDVSKQLEGGWNPTFAILMKNKEYATALPHKLKTFIPATSLGGVESLMEQRYHTDENADPRLIRLSIGVEDIEDIKEDMRRAFIELLKPKAKL